MFQASTPITTTRCATPVYSYFEIRVEANKRKAHFEVQVSDDGKVWQPVKNLRPNVEVFRVADRVDIFRLAGAPNKTVERSYDLTLSRGGVVNVTLTPVKGKALICGAVLEPVAFRTAVNTKPGR